MNRWLAFTPIYLTLVAACNDSSGAASTTTTSTTGAGGGDPCRSQTACPAPEPTQPNDMTQMMGVTANVVDQLGNPAGDVNAAICGTNLCGDITNSNSVGELSVDGGDLMYIAARFSVGYNGKGYAKLSAAIPSAPSYDFGTLRVVRLPAFSSGDELVAGEAATSENVTLGIEAGADIAFDCLTFADPAERKLVATAIDIANWTAAEAPFVDQTLNLEAIIALGPLDTHICPRASLAFPNVRQWPAGAYVDIYIHGTKTYQHYAPYGGWAKAGDAVVSADGNTVTTLAGQGIEVLGTYGARLKP